MKHYIETIKPYLSDYIIEPSGDVFRVNTYQTESGRTEGYKVKLKPLSSNQGILRVCLNNNDAGKKYFNISKLVAALFLEKPEAGMDWISYKDGNNQNVSVDNLYWTSRSARMKRAVREGTAKRYGVYHSRNKLVDDQVLAIRDSKLSTRTLSKTYGVTESCIYNIQKRINWKHL